MTRYICTLVHVELAGVKGRCLRMEKFRFQERFLLKESVNSCLSIIRVIQAVNATFLDDLSAYCIFTF